MDSVFIFNEDGAIIAENLLSIEEAVAYIKGNIKEIMEDNRISTIYVIVDFENKTSNFIKIGFEVVPA